MKRETIERLCEAAVQRGELWCHVGARTGFGWSGVLRDPIPTDEHIDALPLFQYTCENNTTREAPYYEMVVDREHPLHVAFDEIATIKFEKLPYPERKP